MSIELSVQPGIRGLPVYEPGKPIECVAREFGLDPAKVIKLASNENPLGPSPRALEAAREALRGVALYPENSCHFLRQELSVRLGMRPEQLVFGAGSNELFYLLAQVFVGPGVEVVMGRSAFITYRIATLLRGGTPVEVPLQGFRHDLEAMRAAVTPRTRLVFLPNPNNPTGTGNDAESVLQFARSLPPEVVFCYDEAYAEYSENPVDLRPLVEEGLPILCTRTFSKIYGLSGLRIGYGYGPETLVALLERARPPFNVSSVAQEAARAALGDHEFIDLSRRTNRQGMAQLQAGLAGMGLATVPSEGNFLLFEVGEAGVVFAALQQEGVIVRPVGGYGLPHHLRVTVGTEAQNQRFLDTLEGILGRTPAGTQDLPAKNPA